MQRVAELLRAGKRHVGRRLGFVESGGRRVAHSRQSPLLIVVLPHMANVDPMLEIFRRSFSSQFAIAAARSAGFRQVEHEGVDEAFGRRLAALKAIQGPSPPGVVVTTFQALLQPVPSQSKIRGHSRGCARRRDFRSTRCSFGWSRTAGNGATPSSLAGEYSVRGGILDLFPIDAEVPISNT